MLLRRVRLEALKDAPSAFSSTFDLEAGRTDAEWVERAVAGSRGRDRATFFGMVDDQVVGLVGGFRPEASSTAVEMVSMWVAPDARRSGVGAALIDSVRAWAVETEAMSIWAGVMRGNDAATTSLQLEGLRRAWQHHASCIRRLTLRGSDGAVADRVDPTSRHRDRRLEVDGLAVVGMSFVRPSSRHAPNGPRCYDCPRTPAVGVVDRMSDRRRLVDAESVRCMKR